VSTTDSRELLLFWVKDDSETWLHDAADLGESDEEYLNECRQEALHRAAEYPGGRVSEQRVRIADVGYLFPRFPPVVDAEIVR
jgi:hypothetical protein